MLIPIMDFSLCAEGLVAFGFLSKKCRSSGGCHLSFLAEAHIQFRGIFCEVCSGQWHWDRFFCKCFGFLCYCHSTNAPYAYLVLSCWCCIKLAVEVVLNKMLHCSSIAPQSFVCSFLHLHEENNLLRKIV